MHINRILIFKKQIQEINDKELLKVKNKFNHRIWWDSHFPMPREHIKRFYPNYRKNFKYPFKKRNFLHYFEMVILSSNIFNSKLIFIWKSVDRKNNYDKKSYSNKVFNNNILYNIIYTQIYFLLVSLVSLVYLFFFIFFSIVGYSR